jgi:hypothetical protein
MRHQNTPFSGKRIRQNSEKLKQLKRREKRLRRLGLSVVLFDQAINWAQYFQARNEHRKSLANKSK